MSDNTMITVYPFDGSLYTFYESPYLHKLDRELNTVGVEDLTKLKMTSLEQLQTLIKVPMLDQ